jgi:hypothetical protein
MINILRQGVQGIRELDFICNKGLGGADPKGENRKHFTLNLKVEEEFWTPLGFSLLDGEQARNYSEHDSSSGAGKLLDGEEAAFRDVKTRQNDRRI